MGSFDGAELRELAGLYILHIFGKKYGKHRIGLNRDEGLYCFAYTNGPRADRIRKDVIKIFKESFNPILICEANLKAVNFLDVTLNLGTGKYLITNQIIVNYISTLFLTILQILFENLASNISERTNNFSAGETTFNKSKGFQVIHSPKVDLKMRSCFSNKKIYPQ